MIRFESIASEVAYLFKNGPDETEPSLLKTMAGLWLYWKSFLVFPIATVMVVWAPQYIITEYGTHIVLLGYGLHELMGWWGT